jgi:hypothetical protein
MLGDAYAQQIAARSVLTCTTILSMSDGFATCSDLSTILCDVHTFTTKLLINLWRALPRSRRYRIGQYIRQSKPNFRGAVDLALVEVLPLTGGQDLAKESKQKDKEEPKLS